MIIVLGTLTIPVHAAGSTVKVNPLSQTISIGSTFTISIVCIPTQTISSFEMQVVFDPSLLRANSVSKGTFFKDYSTFFNAGSIDNTKGTITNIYDVILGTGSTSTSGTLATISFTAKSTTGTSTIKLKSVGITNNIGYIPITINNGSVQITTQSQQTNYPPVYESISPANKSSNIPISITSLKLTIRDPEGKSFSYTIQTRPNVGSISVNDVGNGTKSCTISGLKYATTYRWYVNATDGVNWKRYWYTFTTTQNPTTNSITITDANPGNGATNIPISTSKITILVQNTQGHTINMYIKTSPNIGSTSRTITVDGTKSISISNLAYNTTYHWYISCQDVTNGQWVNQSYWFKTESDSTNSNPPPSDGGGGTSSNENDAPSVSNDNNPPNPPDQPNGPIFIKPDITYTYTSSATDPDNDTIRLRFDWGDGSYSNWTELVSTNTAISLSHTWKNISSYDISIIAQDKNGKNSSWSDALGILVLRADFEEEQSLVEIITNPINISTNSSIKFIVSNSSILNRSITSYYWEFGDGKTSTYKEPKNTYTDPGQYIVNLSITDNLGETYSKEMIITVYSHAQVSAQNKADFLPIILTSGIIGIVIALIFFLLLFFKEMSNLQIFKKQTILRLKWIKEFIINSSKHIYSLFMKLTLKLKDVKENKTTNIPFQYTVDKNSIKKFDEIELDYIHRKLDKIIMEY